MELSEMMSREFEDDLSRPLERLGFGPAGFISDHRTRVASAINRAKYPPPPILYPSYDTLTSPFNTQRVINTVKTKTT